MSWHQKEDFNGFVERKFEIPSNGRKSRYLLGTQVRCKASCHVGTRRNNAQKDRLHSHACSSIPSNGIAAVAIDGPGMETEIHRGMERRKEEFKKAWTSGGGTDASTEDWTESLKFLEGNFGARPVGWWGYRWAP